MSAFRRLAPLLLLCGGCESHPDVNWPLPESASEPSAPTGLVLRPDDHRIEVSWAPNASDEAVTSYTAYSAAESWTAWDASLPSALISTGLDCCTFTLSGLPNDVPHWFAIAAVNAEGEGPSSPAVEQTPPGWPGFIQGGSAGTESIGAVAYGATGDIYVVGSTDGDLDGEDSAGGLDGFVVHYRANGERIWTRLIGTPSDEEITAIAVDANGNAFIGGYTNGAFPAQSQGGQSDGFIARLSSVDGSIEWLHQFGTSLSDSAQGVAVLGTSAYCVVGFTLGDLDGQTSGGGQDAFVALYDSIGTRQWTRLNGTAGTESANAVTITASERIVVAGTTTGALQGSNIGGTDGFVSERALNGGQAWIRQYGSTVNDNVKGVSVDESRDRIYVSGSTFGSFGGQTVSGPSDPFVVAYDRGPGTVAWTRFIGGSTNENPASIAAAGNGGLFAAYYGTQAITLQDVLIVFLATNGTPAWTSSIASGNLDYFGGISADSDGNAFVSGQTMGSIGAPNAGSWDYFIGKVGPDGILR